jgi:cytochrome c oxidase cbb3-type subunit 3
MRHTGKIIPVSLAALALATLVSCERERRKFPDAGAGSISSAEVRQSELQPGPPTPYADAKNPDEENAYAVSEGKRLYELYNCAGCHAHGGGDIGPPLMDDKWIYGSSPQNIYSVIVEGRPNGMPSFGGKIPEAQLSQIIAYVRSMSGQLRKDVSPGRSDHMSSKKGEQAKPREEPKPDRARHPR